MPAISSASERDGTVAGMTKTIWAPDPVSAILAPMDSNTVHPAIAALRAVATIILLVRGVLFIAVFFPWMSYTTRMWHIRRWSKLLMRALNIQIRTNSSIAPPEGAALLLCNHISWLDIFVLHTWQPSRFVAKAEVNHWPLIGWICRHTGTLFISRQRRHDTGRMRQQMVHGLQRGHVLSVFPEGTTSDGSAILPFNPSLLQAALDVQTPVYTLTLRYYDANGDFTTEPAYIGDMNLLQSLRQVWRMRALQAHIDIATPILEWPGDRRELADACREKMVATLSNTAI